MSTDQQGNAVRYNRLSEEQSPYLLQHQTNPVDWWPWSDEAFQAARSKDKPVFLSIGYSTCHWCHVMEKESFEDPEVAALMNDAFINIKVDREERPDIDAVYMAVCQMVTGGGGWPLTILMMPDKRPFFAGTYFPKHSVPGRMGMMDLVPRVSHIWRTQRQDITGDADRLVRALSSFISADTSGEVSANEALQNAFKDSESSFDDKNGGFGTAPKFPSPSRLRFLLRYWYRTGSAEALQMVRETLKSMRRGGIYDQVGWGFHRYATDAAWIVPHFEKMLYDQALLALTYTEAFQVFGDPLFAQTAHETLNYVLRDLTGSEGGFYSAEDADSEGEEGRFYVWTWEELHAVLGESDAAWVAAKFNVQPEGNYLDEVTRKPTGTNILHGAISREDQRHWESLRMKLFDHRSKMWIHPFKDDKVLTDWNGLMIAAMARAGRAFREPGYIEAAERAARFVDSNLHYDGQLVHRWRQGKAAIPGVLDDYAYMIWGLIELYEATYDPEWLEKAGQLCQICFEKFQAIGGAFYLTADTSEDLLVRTKPYYDGPIPSPNAVMMTNLLRLGRLTASPSLETEAWRIAKAHATLIANSPSGVMAMLSAVDFARGASSEVVIVGDPRSEETRTMIRAISSVYLPNTVTLFKPITSEGRPYFTNAILTHLKSHTMVDGKATAYVCEGFSCKAPTTKVEEMLRQLGVLRQRTTE